MRCPFCGEQDTRVVDSRLAADGYQVRRRRECATCGERYNTFESAELAMPRLRKRDGSREPFDEQKLRGGMQQALYKRPVSTEALEAAVSRILHKLRGQGEQELPARRVGEWVMQELGDLDQIAYVRFASIYRRFQDVNAFREEIERLQQRSAGDASRQQLSLIDDDPKAPQND